MAVFTVLFVASTSDTALPKLGGSAVILDMARANPARRPRGGPPEGRYEPRKGAHGYAPIVASFGALAVTALAVVFTTPHKPEDIPNVVLTTGLLAIAVFASFLAAFSLAAIAAEEDPTANLPAAVMFTAVPVALGLLGILGAFTVLADTFIREATKMFALITVAGGTGAAFFTAAIVADSWSMQPLRLSRGEYKKWRAGQWIKDSDDARRQSNIIIFPGLALGIIAFILRLAGAHVDINLDGVQITIGAGVALALSGTGAALLRIRHPSQGKDQVGIRRWEAWTCTMAIGLYALWLALILPTGDVTIPA